MKAHSIKHLIGVSILLACMFAFAFSASAQVYSTGDEGSTDTSSFVSLLTKLRDGLLGILASFQTSGPGNSGTNVYTLPVTTGGNCTMDAKVCPDGSSVGRQGPNCEFAQCPGEMGAVSLQMKKWVWQSAMVGGKSIKPKDPSNFILEFQNNGTFSASTDCNNMGGQYSVKSNTLLMTETVSTLMACNGSQESDLAQILEETESFELRSGGGELILKTKSGSAVFKGETNTPPLKPAPGGPDTNWINNPGTNGTIVIPCPGTADGTSVGTITVSPDTNWTKFWQSVLPQPDPIKTDTTAKPCGGTIGWDSDLTSGNTDLLLALSPNTTNVVDATFTRGSSCSAYTIDWGDGEKTEVKAPSGLSCPQVTVKAVVQHTYKKGGTYTVTLKQGDNTTSNKITIPTTSTGTPDGTLKLQVTVVSEFYTNVQATFTRGSSCSAYTIDWGDGEKTEVKAPSGLSCPQVTVKETLNHPYKKGNTYTVTLKQGDKTTSSQITVPTMTTGVSPTSPDLQLLMVDGNITHTNVQATFTRGSSCSAYTIDWGDGQITNVTAPSGLSCPQVTVKATVSHTYTNGNSYTVTLKQGDKTTSNTITIPSVGTVSEGPTMKPPVTTTACAIPTGLTVGSSGASVVALQKVLNSDTATQISGTVGGPGAETGYFGQATANAVIKFQEKYASKTLAPAGLTSGSGYVGVNTAKQLSALCAGTSAGSTGTGFVVGQ